MDILSPLKKATAVLPPSFPVKIYNLSQKMGPLKHITTSIIRMAIPNEIAMQEGYLVLNKEDVGVCGTLAWGKFEQFETELFRNEVKAGMNVVDVGANIGYYSLIASVRVGPAGKVFSFEPDTKNASFLKKTIERNKLSNVTVFETALSDTKGERQLYSGGDNKGLFSFADNRNTASSMKVSTDTLDGSMAALGWPAVNVIKMDIEGAEPLVLKGMRETLKRNPHVSIFCEFYPKAVTRVGSSPAEYLKFLADEGFEILLMDEDEKNLLPIKDIQAFLADFPGGESYCNILARR